MFLIRHFLCTRKMRCIGCTIVTSALIVLTFPGCRREQPSEPTGAVSDDRAPVARLTVYCSLDEAFSRPILEKYEQRTGVRINAVFDAEAGKTTGLVNRIMSEGEAGRPRADVFWSGELFQTILLGRRGFLEAYESPAAADIPERFKDPQRHWTAAAARARVLAFDPQRISRDEVPGAWHELGEPEHAGRLAMANPLFGTTYGHVAAMFALWGPDRARAFLTDLREGGVFLADGNMAAVRAVIAGRAAFAATDSDDVLVARRGGASVDLIYPDMGGGGTLLIPFSVGIVKGTREPAAAQELVDHLISAEIERMLAESHWRSVPVRSWLRDELGIQWPPETVVDYHRIADDMDESASAVREILIR